MKIALIMPRGPLYRIRGGIWKKSLRYAPLTLTTLASLIPKELNAEIEIYDEGIEEIPSKIDADLIGITIITGTSLRGYSLAEKFRKEGKTVILGGVHATLMPQEAVQHADAIAVGYAEQTWPQMLRDYKNGVLKKMYIENNVDLSNLPFPRRDLLKHNYLTKHTIEATRGCIYKCEFCVVNPAWGNKQFQKPVEDVVKDIQQMKAKELIFLDLNLIADMDYAKRLFRALAPIKVKWGGLTTVQIGWDEELLDLCAKSGCKGLLIGLESLSLKTLQTTRKGFNLMKAYPDIIDGLHRRGISLMGCFVFGLDGDDQSVFEKTAQFCLDTKIDLPRFAICTPFPNTALFHRLKGEGRILTEDWGLYDGQHVVFQPKEMTVQESYDGTKWAWKKTYSTSSIFRRVLRSNMHLKQLFKYTIPANFAYKYYAHNLSRFYTCGGVSPTEF